MVTNKKATHPINHKNFKNTISMIKKKKKIERLKTGEHEKKEKKRQEEQTTNMPPGTFSFRLSRSSAPTVHPCAFMA